MVIDADANHVESLISHVTARRRTSSRMLVLRRVARPGVIARLQLMGRQQTLGEQLLAHI